MTEDEKKHGNTGKRNALRTDLDGGTFGFRISDKQRKYLNKIQKALNVRKADYVRQLIDDDMKQDKNK